MTLKVGIAFFLKLLISSLFSRNFGILIRYFSRNYIDINVSDLQNLEKLHIKRNKSQLDISYLINFKNFDVFPKFIDVYNIGEEDMYETNGELPKNEIN